MQRKPGYPVANCNIKLPDSTLVAEDLIEEEEPVDRRLKLINFGHKQWGFNNWSWAVTKQDLDFVDVTNGRYSAGVAAFVSVTVKSLDIHRENVGYATSAATSKGAAIHRSRKCAVTNALRETLLSFGGTVALELTEMLELLKFNENPNHTPNEVLQENNQNLANKVTEPKNLKQSIKKDLNIQGNIKTPVATPQNPVLPVVKTAVVNPPVAKAHPLPPAPRAPAPPAPSVPRPPLPQPVAPHALRHNSNEGKCEGVTEEEARAERKRRQRQAEEEFRLKHLAKQNNDEDIDTNKSLEVLMLALPTQEIIENSGNTEGKRKSPVQDPNTFNKRRLINRLLN